VNIIRRENGSNADRRKEAGNIGRDHAHRNAWPHCWMVRRLKPNLAMALGALDRRHTTRWLRNLSFSAWPMPLITVEFHLTPDVVGPHRARSLVFGAVFGAGLGRGRWQIILARRKLNGLPTMVIIAVGAATSGAGPRDSQCSLSGQLLVGVGVGIDFPTSSSYVSEVLPKYSRARMMVATTCLAISSACCSRQ